VRLRHSSLALFGSADHSEEGQLSGVKRKWLGHRRTDAMTRRGHSSWGRLWRAGISAEHWATSRQMDRFEHSGDSVHCARRNRPSRRGSQVARLDRTDIGHSGRDANRHRIRLSSKIDKIDLTNWRPIAPNPRNYNQPLFFLGAFKRTNFIEYISSGFQPSASAPTEEHARPFCPWMPSSLCRACMTVLGADGRGAN
jgi:hypothetical protein